MPAGSAKAGSRGGQVLHVAAVEVEPGVVSQQGLKLLAQVEQVPAVEVGAELRVLGRELLLVWTRGGWRAELVTRYGARRVCSRC